VNLAEGEVASEVQLLRQQISSIESVLAEAYKGREPSKNDPVVNTLELKRHELKAALKNNCSVKHQKQLALVNKAIETIVPDVTELKVDRSSGKLKLMVKNFGNRVNISQLSQGQKTLVALTGDIARRLVVLNPNAENALTGHGIVIIDEIELHLHPKWQQVVLLGLQKIFSNIQFVVTTHSPLVLSHIDPKHTSVIKLISADNEINKVSLRDTYGRNADLIYEGNMGVSSRPKEVQSKIEEIFKLIERKELSQARSEIATLTEKIGEDGQLTKALTLIKRMELIGK
jgi:predicted ATP-binding protein involved in virulence